MAVTRWQCRACSGLRAPLWRVCRSSEGTRGTPLVGAAVYSGSRWFIELRSTRGGRCSGLWRAKTFSSSAAPFTRVL
jgi:hypothetical protein